MNTDGNAAAINRHLAEQEAYDAAQPPDDMYCPACDETINGKVWPSYIGLETCPNCGFQLKETP
jgi:uncharacterized protein (DUF983 family)